MTNTTNGTTNELSTIEGINNMQDYSFTYRGEVTKDDWTSDEWLLVIKRNGKTEQFDYYTGLGHRKAVKGYKNPHKNPRSIAAVEWDKQNLKPVKPKLANAINCLLLNSQACDMSFNNWCDDYGYDNDSIKARGMYDQCQKIGDKLNKLFSYSELQAMQEALQDY